jgi:hypothetical protein
MSAVHSGRLNTAKAGCILALNMKRWMICLLMPWLVVACQRPDKTAPALHQATIERNGVQYTIEAVRECRYPADNPLYEQRWNKKLLLLQIKVHCNGVNNNRLLIPNGAMLTDKRANNYETSPVVIAMAQNNHCIAGNDIKDYNAIWNGDIKAGETYTAFVLGFELPEDAMPDKLYWNNEWKNNQLYFVFRETDYAINR